MSTALGGRKAMIEIEDRIKARYKTDSESAANYRSDAVESAGRGFATARQIGARTGLSESTVIRLATRSAMPAFRAAIRRS